MAKSKQAPAKGGKAKATAPKAAAKAGGKKEKLPNSVMKALTEYEASVEDLVTAQQGEYIEDAKLTAAEGTRGTRKEALIAAIIAYIQKRLNAGK